MQIQVKTYLSTQYGIICLNSLYICCDVFVAYEFFNINFLIMQLQSYQNLIAILIITLSPFIYKPSNESLLINTLQDLLHMPNSSF